MVYHLTISRIFFIFFQRLFQLFMLIFILQLTAESHLVETCPEKLGHAEIRRGSTKSLATRSLSSTLKI